jgi:hypothetical protein
MTQLEYTSQDHGGGLISVYKDLKMTALLVDFHILIAVALELEVFLMVEPFTVGIVLVDIELNPIRFLPESAAGMISVKRIDGPAQACTAFPAAHPD